MLFFTQVLFPVSLIAAVSAGVVVDKRAAFTLQNGKDAQALNKKFQSLTPASPCKAGDQACVKGKLGQCIGGKFVLSSCAGGLQCVVLPLVNKPGTRYATIPLRCMDLMMDGSLTPSLIIYGDTASHVTP